MGMSVLSIHIDSMIGTQATMPLPCFLFGSNVLWHYSLKLDFSDRAVQLPCNSYSPLTLQLDCTYHMLCWDNAEEWCLQTCRPQLFTVKLIVTSRALNSKILQIPVAIVHIYSSNCTTVKKFYLTTAVWESHSSAIAIAISFLHMK